ncbi:MAG: hypothetical protein LBQ42_07735 [Synergistaceae bacterium]|nr:hypothetical protein [Synergistaceae bacterium]
MIVGFLGEGRLALADAKKFNIDRPKSKNPKHVQSTSHVVAKVTAWVESGKNIDHGELCRFFALLKGTSDVKGVLDDGLDELDKEESACRQK